MESDILNIISMSSERMVPVPFEVKKIAAFDVANKFKAFTKWKDDLHCPFELHYNGLDKTKDKIRYKKSDKFYTLDEVWEYWKRLK